MGNPAGKRPFARLCTEWRKIGLSSILEDVTWHALAQDMDMIYFHPCGYIVTWDSSIK
jgi:hypothetical protein